MSQMSQVCDTLKPLNSSQKSDSYDSQETTLPHSQTRDRCRIASQGSTADSDATSSKSSKAELQNKLTGIQMVIKNMEFEQQQIETKIKGSKTKESIDHVERLCDKVRLTLTRLLSTLELIDENCKDVRNVRIDSVKRHVERVLNNNRRSKATISEYRSLEKEESENWVAKRRRIEEDEDIEKQRTLPVSDQKLASVSNEVRAKELLKIDYIDTFTIKYGEGVALGTNLKPFRKKYKRGRTKRSVAPVLKSRVEEENIQVIDLTDDLETMTVTAEKERSSPDILMTSPRPQEPESADIQEHSFALKQESDRLESNLIRQQGNPREKEEKRQSQSDEKSKSDGLRLWTIKPFTPELEREANEFFCRIAKFSRYLPITSSDIFRADPSNLDSRPDHKTFDECCESCEP